MARAAKFNPVGPVGYTPLSPEHVARLREILGEGGLRVDEQSLERASHDETEDYRYFPEALALPGGTDAVSRLLDYANEHRIAVTARGAGTGLSGGALPVARGIALSLERMDRIRAIDEENLSAVVESGVITGVFQDTVAERGLYYPPDPSSRDSCTLGGNIAEDAAGPHSCKYGPTRKWVMGLEAVLADGSVVHTGGANRKDATGYNLTQLLVGSEGTLAVVTAATLRLIPKPAETLVIAVPFEALEDAAAAVAAIFREGHEPAACEILEERALRAVEAIHEVPAQLRGKAALLVIELDGDDAGKLLEQAAGIGELCESLGAAEPIAAAEAGEQRRLWEMRRKVGEAVKHRSVYREADTVVPRARLAEAVKAARQAAADHGLEVVCYGHAADGNLHVNILKGDLSGEQWAERRDRVEEALFERIVALGGKLSGEHGIGWTQRRLMPLALGEAELALMRRIKAAFDPKGILNPGKIFPD